MEYLNITCPTCGQDAGPITRSERHVQPQGHVLIHRQRRCAAGHTTMTHGREYEEVFTPDEIVSGLIPVESEAAYA